MRSPAAKQEAKKRRGVVKCPRRGIRTLTARRSSTTVHFRIFALYAGDTTFETSFAGPTRVTALGPNADQASSEVH